MVELSEEYQEIGEQVKAELFPNLEGYRVAWLLADHKKMQNGARVFADTRLVPEQYRWTCDYDFLITFYEPNCDELDENQKKILCEHELLHCGTLDGEPVIKPHDFEEFYQIANKYGIDWCADAQEEGFELDFDFSL